MPAQNPSTLDAEEWAREFIKRVIDDVGIMPGFEKQSEEIAREWFANAIERARSAGFSVASKEFQAKHDERMKGTVVIHLHSVERAMLEAYELGRSHGRSAVQLEVSQGDALRRMQRDKIDRLTSPKDRAAT